MTPSLNAICLECGEPFVNGGVGPVKEFCCQHCRQRWNNRRLQRGAELYDLYMAHRFDRRVAKCLGVFQAINRLASDFRREDGQRRAMRRSWRQPASVLAERPYLKAQRWQVRAGR